MEQKDGTGLTYRGGVGQNFKFQGDRPDAPRGMLPGFLEAAGLSCRIFPFHQLKEVLFN